jgi:hypothetical protein
VDERGKATEGDLRARIVWHVQEAQRSCSVGLGCREATPDGSCCGEVVWIEIAQQESMLTLPGRSAR